MPLLYSILHGNVPPDFWKNTPSMSQKNNNCGGPSKKKKRMKEIERKEEGRMDE